MHLNYSKEDTYFHQKKSHTSLFRNNWTPLASNCPKYMKFATLSDQNCRHMLVFFYYDQPLVGFRGRVPLPWARVARSLTRKSSLARMLSPWIALPSDEKAHSDLYFFFLQKAPVWEIAGAEFSKSTTHTADGISIRFPRVTRIRDDKDWETANDLPHLRVSYRWLIPGSIQKNWPPIGHFKIF